MNSLNAQIDQYDDISFFEKERYEFCNQKSSKTFHDLMLMEDIMGVITSFLDNFAVFHSFAACCSYFNQIANHRAALHVTHRMLLSEYKSPKFEILPIYSIECEAGIEYIENFLKNKKRDSIRSLHLHGNHNVTLSNFPSLTFLRTGGTITNLHHFTQLVTLEVSLGENENLLIDALSKLKSLRHLVLDVSNTITVSNNKKLLTAINEHPSLQDLTIKHVTRNFKWMINSFNETFNQMREFITQCSKLTCLDIDRIEEEHDYLQQTFAHPITLIINGTNIQQNIKFGDSIKKLILKRMQDAVVHIFSSIVKQKLTQLSELIILDDELHNNSI